MDIKQLSGRALCLALALGLANAAHALPVGFIPNDNNSGVPDLHDAFNIVAGTSFTSNADLQPYRVDPSDQSFSLGATPNRSVTLIGLSAGNTNTLGFYTDLGVGANRNPLLTDTGDGFRGDGSSGNPFGGTSYAPDPGASTFGFYLTSSGSGTTTFFSQAGLNADGLDHMITYSLLDYVDVLNGLYFSIDGGPASHLNFTNPMLIGWEDLVGGGDRDYNDMMFLIDVKPAPEPGTLALLGLGIAAFGVSRRRRTR